MRFVFTTRRTAAAISIAAVLGACGGEVLVNEPPATTQTPSSTLHISRQADTLLVTRVDTLQAALVDAATNRVVPVTPVWTSGDPTIADVSAAGIVRAAGRGRAWVFATYDGKTDSTNVSVFNLVGQVRITPKPVTIAAGQTTSLRADVTSELGQPVTDVSVSWTSLDTTVLSLSSGGSVKGKKVGKTRISASAGGITDTTTATVTLVPVASVTIALGASTLYVGQSTTATVVTYDSAGNVLTGRPITYASTQPSVATIDVNGNVKAVGAGSTIITAGAENATASTTLTVFAVPVASVNVSPASVSLNPGQGTKLVATALDSAGGTLTGRSMSWSSSNTAVATVDGSGNVTAVAAGSASVSATSGGKTGSSAITVTVPAAVLQSVNLTPDSTAINAGATTQYAFAGKYSDGSTKALTPTYSATGGTISSSGLYTAGQTAGKFVVRAQDPTSGMRDSSVVVVSALPVVLQSVALTPDSTSAYTGGTVQYALSGKYSDGSTKTLSGSFSATGGTISSAGLYTAGQSTGKFIVRAADAASGLTDSTAVTVVAPPNPTLSVGPGANEPTGFVAQYDNPMSTGLTTTKDQYGFFGYSGEYSDVSVAQSTSAPASAPYYYHMLFPANSNPQGTALFRFQAGTNFSANNGNLYMRMRLFISSNYTHNQNVGTKFWFPRPGSTASGEGSINHFFGFTDANSTTLPHSKMELFFGTQFAGGGAGTASFYSGYDLPKGTWHDVEWLLTANTPGQSNGGLKIWVDGVLRQSASNVMYFQSGMVPHWGYVWVDPTYGFGSGPTPNYDMWWDVDQWYVSVR